jgi:hypothetical protein
MKSNINRPRTRLLWASVAAVLLGACTSFESRVQVAQAQIDESFASLGYTPKDVVEFKSTPHTKKGRSWVERTIRFQDKGDRPLPQITKFFRQDAQYDFEHYMTIGESDSDMQFIRWYEFKLDKTYPIYRIEFVRPQRGKSIQRALEAADTLAAPSSPAPASIAKPR